MLPRQQGGQGKRLYFPLRYAWLAGGLLIQRNSVCVGDSRNNALRTSAAGGGIDRNKTLPSLVKNAAITVTCAATLMCQVVSLVKWI